MAKTIHLYVKTHNVSGLKYFGKTTSNPHSYRGSGKVWVEHLKQFGNDVTTKIIGSFNDHDECAAVARKFSADNNIVESDEWANLIPETLGGWNTNPHKGKQTMYERYGGDYYKQIAKLSRPSRSMQDAWKQKLRENPNCAAGGKSNLGRVREKIICPHCGKSGARNVMSRWHFDSCPSKEMVT